MNIKEAKIQIKNAIKAYFSKDEYGDYIIPIEKQRPVFLMGPPGIGKTAIIEQIAQELDVAVLSYSMTHHTRQSALGLPIINKKIYGGKEYEISEYTMSEIIASVYDMIEQSGKKEGILFLDEINCVSETLAPIMLQFLQYKIFGRHQVPKGWIVVTAGNPPQYNNSVREFDIVTWDRLKRIDIEPDFECWKEYAYSTAIHPAIITYLDIKRDKFYIIKSSADGKQFVTARGWDDLSKMIMLYEKNHIKIDLNLISQYIQEPQTAKDFLVYYDLFNKYKSDYQIDMILSGKVDEIIKKRAKESDFDERVALMGIIVDAINEKLKEATIYDELLLKFFDVFKKFRMSTVDKKINVYEDFVKIVQQERDKEERQKLAGSISALDLYINKKCFAFLDTIAQEINWQDSNQAFVEMKSKYEELFKRQKELVKNADKELGNVFDFCQEVFGIGNEMLILVTELTMTPTSAKFISNHGSKAYFENNKQLLFFERRANIINELKSLDLNQLENFEDFN